MKLGLVEAKPYKQLIVVRRSNQKLSAKYYRPYKILRKIGVVAYELNSLAESKVHPVFHVSSLEPYRGPILLSSTILPNNQAPRTALRSELILDKKIKRKGNLATTQVMVKWLN